MIRDEMLVAFLYLLARDELPAGRIERIIGELEGVAAEDTILGSSGVVYSSVPLESQARAWVTRLRVSWTEMRRGHRG